MKISIQQFLTFLSGIYAYEHIDAYTAVHRSQCPEEIADANCVGVFEITFIIVNKHYNSFLEKKRFWCHGLDFVKQCNSNSYTAFFKTWVTVVRCQSSHQLSN